MSGSQNNPPEGNGHDVPRQGAPPTSTVASNESHVAELPAETVPSRTERSNRDQQRNKSESATISPAVSRRATEQAQSPIAADSHYGFDLGHAEEHADTPHDAPPAYTELPGRLSSDNNGLGTNAIVADDGRVNIRIDQKGRTLSQFILPQIQRQLTQSQHEPAPPPPYVPEFLGGAPGQLPPPPLNVVIQVVGSRGDVQPFVALGKVLKDTYGHRVRLATHPTFQDFVTENGLEFFSIGGDPAELMAFMVKNPGLMPGFDTLRSGDVGKRRKGIAEILKGTWRSCIESGNGLGVDPVQQSVEEWMGIEDQLPENLRRPFVADAIIANPPAFGHLHCAEKLGIPLHMMFTMPWSPTQQFPHPLANIQASNADATITNYISYIMVDALTWQGLGDVINRFRKDTLRLDPISTIWGPAVLARLKIPFTYCWSPALIPKPRDWSQHISVAGFYFLNLASNYTPEPALAAFLDAGEPPVYIGFGSIVVDDPNAMTKMIFDAVKITGKRALVSKGWGGLGADEMGVPEGVFMLGNCPHDWLFQKVSAVVHHGGAGTTAAGIAAGRPTVVVPFFGDQAFWGAMVSRAGAGPDPVPYKDLTAEKLAENITEALKPESLEKAQELCDKIKQEDGCQTGAQSFHQMLNYEELRCAVIPNKPAVWRIKRSQTILSARAATVLAQQGEINFADLKLHRAREYVPDEGPIDPVSGAASALIGTTTSVMMGVADMPIQTLKMLNIHPDSRSNKGKGKSTASGTETIPDAASSVGESSRVGRSLSRAPTGGDQVSPLSSGVNTPLTSEPLDAATGPGQSVPELATPKPGTSDHRSTFMSQAFDESTRGSRSASREGSRLDTPCSPGHRRRTSSQSIPGPGSTSASAAAEVRSNSGTPASQAGFAENVESAVDTGKGLARIVGAGFRSPMDFSLNVAKGFHNVPKLYGADVRQVDKVTDLQSGLRTAAKEFGYGLYDGITGIVTDPYKGAKKEGGVGFVKGVGRGIMSVPFRVMGGAWSVPGYAMKGLYQEMIKSKGKSVQNYIIAARISQGYDEASTISQNERDEILSRWKFVKVGIKKKRNPGAEQMDSLSTLVADKKQRKRDRWERVNSHFAKPEGRPSFPPSMSESNSYSDLGLSQSVSRSSAATAPAGPPSIPKWRQEELRRAGTWNTSRSAAVQSSHSNQSDIALEAELIAEEEAEQRELDAAIAASVAESSRGNPDEDKLVASAIRASIAELERSPADGSSEDDEELLLKRAMQASLDEASRSGYTEEEKKALEETLRKSILETGRRRQHGTDSEWNSDDDADTEDDEEFQRILAESKELAHLQANHPQDYAGTTGGAQQASGVIEAMSQVIAANQAPDDEDEELKKVLAESEKAEKDRMANLEKQKTEEDIVMEYVRKQSLLEEEHRQRLAQGRDTSGEASGSK